MKPWMNPSFLLQRPLRNYLVRFASYAFVWFAVLVSAITSHLSVPKSEASWHFQHPCRHVSIGVTLPITSEYGNQGDTYRGVLYISLRLLCG